MSNPIGDSALNLKNSNNGQSTQGIIVQNYCNSILQQPAVIFPASSNLGQYQIEIDDALTVAQDHAKTYLGSIQPSIIANISNIINYYNLNNTVPAVCPAGSSVDQWILALGVLQVQASTYQAQASALSTTLSQFATTLDTDSGSFQTIVSDLNSSVNGDNGALAAYQTQLDTAQRDIDGAIAGVVGGAVGIAGGIFIICVGAIAEFVTAGVSTGVVVAGAVLVAGSVGGEVAADVVLAKAVQAKASIITAENELKTEVTLASSISNTYSSLKSQVQAAAAAAGQMANAWTTLGSDLGQLSTDIQSGITGPDAARTMFLDAASSEVAEILLAAQTINAQMAGVGVTSAPAGQQLPAYLNSKIPSGPS